MRKSICCLIAGCLLTICLFAQNVEVTGRVVDSSGAPVPNTTVLLKGLSKGTATDIEGYFNLKVAVGTTLVVNSIGY
jgi:hypothetical protein